MTSLINVVMKRMDVVWLSVVDEEKQQFLNCKRALVEPVGLIIIIIRWTLTVIPK